MSKKRIYVLFSHGDGSSDFEVEFATDDSAVMMKYLIDSSDSETDYSDAFYLDCKEELTTETLSRFSQSDLGVDFGFDAFDRRVVLKSMEVDVPESGVIWGVFANGNEVYSWLGNMLGLFESKDEAVDFIIKDANVDDEEASDAFDELTECGSYTDADYTYWVPVSFRI